jgi:hypothetical protein
MERDELWAGPDYDPLDISSYSVTHQRHIIGLGLIADLASQLESAARWMLGDALGIDDIAEINHQFLGKRISALAKELDRIADLQSDELVRRYADWARKADAATERRNKLIHRQVFQNRLLPARRAQVPEELGTQAIELVIELTDLVDDAYELNMAGWISRHRRGKQTRPMTLD